MPTVARSDRDAGFAFIVLCRLESHPILMLDRTQHFRLRGSILRSERREVQPFTANHSRRAVFVRDMKALTPRGCRMQPYLRPPCRQILCKLNRSAKTHLSLLMFINLSELPI
jgi:hypothetical protein